MLALLSRASIKKHNPQGEWLKGMALGRRLSIDDFVIPLNVEGLTPDEIPWNLQPINYIPFTPNWATGLRALIKKLESVNAPRTLNEGLRLAKQSMVVDNMIKNEPETLISNCYEITKLPRFIFKYRAMREMSTQERRQIRKDWACRDVSPNLVLAFLRPSSIVCKNHRLRYIRKLPWRETTTISGVDTRNLIVSLIHSCIRYLLSTKGMTYCERSRVWYLPPGTLDKDKIVYKVPYGRRGWFKGVGERRFRTPGGLETYRYHLSPSFDVRHEGHGSFFLILRNRVYLTNVHGEPLSGRTLVSRRKHLCKNWFNKEWCVRNLGIIQLLTDRDMLIRVGPTGDQQLIVDANPVSPIAPYAIEDTLVESIDESYTLWHDDDEIEIPMIGEPSGE